MIDEALARVFRVVLREELAAVRAHIERFAAQRAEGPAAVDPLLTPQDVAEELKVTAETVRGWIRRGLLRPIDLGEAGRRPSIRVRRSELERFLESRTRKSGTARRRDRDRSSG